MFSKDYSWWNAEPVFDAYVNLNKIPIVYC